MKKSPKSSILTLSAADKKLLSERIWIGCESAVRNLVKGLTYLDEYSLGMISEEAKEPVWAKVYYSQSIRTCPYVKDPYVETHYFIWVTWGHQIFTAECFSELMDKIHALDRWRVVERYEVDKIEGRIAESSATENLKAKINGAVKA